MVHKTVAIDMPSDAQRVQKVKTLVEAGYAHRVMLSHDIHTKHRLVRRLVLDIIPNQLGTQASVADMVVFTVVSEPYDFFYRFATVAMVTPTF